MVALLHKVWIQNSVSMDRLKCPNCISPTCAYLTPIHLMAMSTEYPVLLLVLLAGWAGLKEHRTVFEEKMPTSAIVTKLNALGLLLDYEYAELKGKINCPMTNLKLIDFLLCKDPELVERFKKVLSDIPGYNHLVRLL